MFTNDQERFRIMANGSSDQVVVGCNNSTDELRFMTGTSQSRMVILQSGEIGINTSSPTSRLDINGNLRISNVATGTPNVLLIGVQEGGVNDLNVRRLGFT
jgi:hypothetical protein